MTRVGRLAVAATTTGVTGLAASILPFVRPATGQPARADAVVVLSGDHGERMARAMELLDAGVASTLVVDGVPDSPAAIGLCAGPQPFEVVCLMPEPDDTRGEARAAGRLAASRGWDRVVVSTSNFHVARSEVLFQRCVDAEVIMVGADPPYGWRRVARAIAREWVATAYLLTVSRSC